MFEADPAPRLFALPPGVDFPHRLVEGLQQRTAGQLPEAMARVTLILNTERMRRRVTDAFTASGAHFLPRLRLIADIGLDLAFAGLAPAVPPLRRRLELTEVVARLLEAEPDLAPRTALFDLADSLANLMEEMSSEGVSAERIASLDVSRHSAHWGRTQAFLGIIAQFLGDAGGMDSAARLRAVVLGLIARWQTSPPLHPVIIAGSTASRGTTSLLMQAVARLPQGALVLPGFDFDLPPEVWDGMGDALASEDHPQFRYRRLMTLLEASPADVRPWMEATPPQPARNRLISLSLRPAPVTDRWRAEGPSLGDLHDATDGMTLIEAHSPREEAVAIALILRKAAEDGVCAALVTPDRGLTRQVAAALDRWGILPDDSAGTPLSQSAPGRLLRQVAHLMSGRMTGDALLAILKHPLVGTGGDRGVHLRLSREFELRLRRRGPPFPDAGDIAAWAASVPDVAAPGWAAALVPAFRAIEMPGVHPLARLVAHHRRVTECLARGTGTGTGKLWEAAAGIAACTAMEELTAEAGHGGAMSAFDYANLLDSILSTEEVRDPVQVHANVRIWGTLESRVQGADLIILGGLNEGTWPKGHAPDPWLNRPMRQAAGLLLPDRQIGLSAHDYQQAIAAPRVVLSRAHRDADAETVAARWVNRLTNLMLGLPLQNGPQALERMRAKGRRWLEMAASLERPATAIRPATRPAPRPPVAARPRELPVTAIRTLIRDPYAIYARYILRLRPLDPLRPGPDAALRGQAIHLILERFLREGSALAAPETPGAARARLMRTAEDVLDAQAPWPASRTLWLARVERAADFFLAAQSAHGGVPVLLEAQGKAPLGTLGFTLNAKPDRIDVLPDGRTHIVDYKTGTPPTPAQQKHFDKQLLLQAGMAAQGAFGPSVPRDVARISYIGLGAKPTVVETVLDPAEIAEVWEGLHTLIARYMDRDQSYTARRALFEDREVHDYDHLARLGEWKTTDRADPQDVG